MSTHLDNDDVLPSLEGEYIAEALDAVENRAGGSRASIARLLGLSRTTSSKIVSELIDLKLLVEKNLLREGRGRPGMLLDLDTSTWRAIGAEYHSGHWTFVETDLKGSILRTSSLKVARDTSPDAFLDGLAQGLDEFSADVSGELLPTFGVGSPGLVDCDRGVILRADDLGWKDVRVAEYVKKRLGAKVLLINRNRGAGLAEARFGAGRGVHQAVYIGIGTGISAAFMIDGKLVHGSFYSAGEIGHIAMDTLGPICGCGKRGCLHVYASGGAIAKHAAELLGRGRESSLKARAEKNGPLTGEEVCLAAASGDAVAIECVLDAATKLGLAVANIVTTFNPDKIIIGGPIGLLKGPLLGALCAEAERWAMPHAFQAVRIERGALGEFVGAIGGACLVLDRKLPLAASVRGR